VRHRTGVVDKDSIAAIRQVERNTLVSLIAAGAAVLVPSFDDLPVLDEGRETLAESVDVLADSEIELFDNLPAAIFSLDVSRAAKTASRVSHAIGPLKVQRPIARLRQARANCSAREDDLLVALGDLHCGPRQLR
jgi:hypothetical protein